MSSIIIPQQAVLLADVLYSTLYSLLELLTGQHIYGVQSTSTSSCSVATGKVIIVRSAMSSPLQHILGFFCRHISCLQTDILVSHSVDHVIETLVFTMFMNCGTSAPLCLAAPARVILIQTDNKLKVKFASSSAFVVLRVGNVQTTRRLLSQRRRTVHALIQLIHCK